MLFEIPVKDKMDAGRPVKISVMKEVIKPTIPHRHAGYHELIFLNAGSGYHEIDGQQLEIVPPVTYYLRPGQTHCWNFTAIPKGFVILFREELLLKQDVDALFHFPSGIPLLSPEVLFQLVTLFYQEYASADLPADTTQAYLHLLVTRLQQSLALLQETPPPVNNLFQQFRQLVHAHFAARKDLAFYAAQLHVTTAVLNQACKKAMDKTPGAIINERVLLEAKVLLSATEKSVNEVAEELGFTDSPHFIKFFKQHTHLTPRSYREMAQQKQ